MPSHSERFRKTDGEKFCGQKMDEMRSEESFQGVPEVQVPITGEERLFRRLGEVERCELWNRLILR